MHKKLEGQIIYLPFGHVNDYVYNKKELKDYDGQQIKEASILNFENDGTKKIIFDVSGSDDYWGGYVKGFLYTDGKFIGNFHYLSEANISVESMNGRYSKLERGYEIRGIGYSEGIKQFEFYLILEEPEEEKKQKNIIAKVKTNLITPLSKSGKTLERTVTIKDVLNNELVKAIITKAEKLKTKKTLLRYDLYSHIINWNPVPDTTNDLLIAMCVAYAWMPTMLDVYVKDKKELTKLLNAVRGLGEISTIKKFDGQTSKIEAWLLELSAAINNSIVGTSKVLHLFYHQTIPIIDSNVLKGWDKILKKHYKKYPELKLPLNIPGVAHRQVNTYMKYWRLLLMMKQNTGSKSIRYLEEPFYWIGMK